MSESGSSPSHVGFGFGFVTQGHLVTDMETHRLLAKKAWMLLWEYLWRHDEVIKASRLQVPWSLEGDGEISECLFKAREMLSKYDSPDKLKSYISSCMDEEFWVDEEKFDVEPKNHWPRIKWLNDRLIALNPATLLEVGAGPGIVAVQSARLGVSVTAINCVEGPTRGAKVIQEKENLPIEWIHELFEAIDFGESKFDVVFVAEILEHVANDLDFLQRCVDLARNEVLVTVPAGSVCGGFVDRVVQDENREHIRAYSSEGIKALISQISGVELVEFTIQKSLSGVPGLDELTGQCYCARLKKTEVPHGNKDLSPERASIEVGKPTPK